MGRGSGGKRGAKQPTWRNFTARQGTSEEGTRHKIRTKTIRNEYKNSFQGIIGQDPGMGRMKKGKGGENMNETAGGDIQRGPIISEITYNTISYHVFRQIYA